MRDVNEESVTAFLRPFLAPLSDSALLVVSDYLFLCKREEKNAKTMHTCLEIASLSCTSQARRVLPENVSKPDQFRDKGTCLVVVFCMCYWITCAWDVAWLRGLHKLDVHVVRYFRYKV